MGIFLAFLEILTATLPTAVIHRPYTPDPLTVLGGGSCAQNHVFVRLATGVLPAGLHLSADGHFLGIPRETGVFTFQARAENACQVVVKTFHLRVSGAPILAASPEALEFEYTAGGQMPPPQPIRVSSSWNDMPYSVEAIGAPWLELDPMRGRTPVEDSGFTADVVAVAVDPAKLAPGSYSALVKITAWETVRDVKIPVTFKIRPAGAAAPGQPR